MRAIVHTTFAEPADVLHVEERELPEPAAGEVRLRILLSPIHNHDLWTVRGTYGFVPDLPARAGTEAVAVVDALGEGVEALEIGQRVSTGGSFGAWAEHVVAKAAGLLPVPEALPDEAAAQLVAMPFSTISLLESLELEHGDWLVQNAANGAVGRMLAQLARARGINVLGLVRRAAGVEELAEQGITGVVATDDDSWRERARELVGEGKVRAAVDSVSGAATRDLLSVLDDGGSLVSFGAMGDGTMQVPTSDIIFRRITVRGFWGSVVSTEMDAETRGRLFGELLERIGDGELTLPVSGVFPLEEAKAAVEASLTPGRVGKVLFRP